MDKVSNRSICIWSVLFALFAFLFLTRNLYVDSDYFSFFMPVPVWWAALGVVWFRRLKEWPVVAALFFSGLGDLGGVSGSFLLQVGFFAVAQIFYIVALLKDARFSIPRLLAGVAIVMTIFCLVYYLSRGIASPDRVAMIGYAVIISVMLASSVFNNSSSRLLFLSAAVVFVISDSLIAWRRCIGDYEWNGEMVMITYYLAQYLFALGAIKKRVKNNRYGYGRFKR